MKKYIFGFIALGLIIGTAIFVSCNNSKVDNRKKCSWEVYSTEGIKLNLMDKTIDYEVVIRKKETERMSIEDACQKTTEKVFQYFNKYCVGKGLVFDGKPMYFVIYYNEHITQSLSITDEHIKGISAYTVEGDNIMHHLYVRDEQSNFYEAENANVAVPAVTLNHIFFYLENYVFTDVQTEIQNVSTIGIEGDFALKIDKIKKYERTPMRFEKSVKRRSPETHLQYAGGGYGCSDCPPDIGGMCKKLPGDIWYHCNENPLDEPGGGCTANEIAMYHGEHFGYAFDPELMYAFRDYFLSNYDKGQIYIDNYYDLGLEWVGNITFELAIETAKVLINFNPVMRAFLYPDKYMDEIMFTDELSDALLNLLDSYETITKSSEGKDILNSIRDDINLLRNLTLKEILDALK